MLPATRPARMSFRARGEKRERSAITGRTAPVMMRSVGWKHAVPRGLGPEEGMEALEIESQADKAPLASRRPFPAQRELAEAEHLLDDADHRFDGTLARAIDSFAQGRPELVGHFHLGARLYGRRVGQRREALLPTRMMGITARGDVGLDAALLTRRHS